MLESLLQDARSQWQESRLLRLGTWGVGLIVLLYLLLWLDDQLALKQLEWRRQSQALADLQTLQQQRHWPTLVQKLEAQQEQLLNQSWQAQTPGLAKAALREFLNNTAKPLGLNLRGTEFAEPQPLTSNVWEMRGRLTAVSDGSQAPWAWLAELESHQPAVILDHLDIRLGRNSGVSARLEFRVALTGLEGPRP